MSAKDELRRMLDERGVEHYDGTESTLWGYEDYNEFTGIYRFSADETSDGYMQVRLWRVTPEQAIAATLGSCNCSNNCTNSERTDVPRLPHFWTHDGVLHVELPKLPESISVRLPDQRDREVGSAMVWQYTRDSGTCHECADMDKEIVRCRDCKHGHITINGESCKWCDLIATHDIDGNEPNNGYDPEPYFDADFFCAWGRRADG